MRPGRRECNFHLFSEVQICNTVFTYDEFHVTLFNSLTTLADASPVIRFFWVKTHFSVHFSGHLVISAPEIRAHLSALRKSLVISGQLLCAG